MSVYAANGCGHRILARLEEGPAGFADLVKAARANGCSQSKGKRKAHFVLGALERDGLVDDRRGLTAKGREALADMRDGLDYGAPTSVVVFGRRAA